jgi:hypothetical protein
MTVKTNALNINFDLLGKITEARQRLTLTEQRDILKTIKQNANLSKTQAGRIALYY